ncbi:MAG: YkgJ family cysteine cluster protein [Selenomonadaceae bacterium]|nr:YkgJ family cysteine cluster protein [Selenomonadaceae bacterium]
MFDCERCGRCCRRVGRTALGEDMALLDGSCRYLDKATNLCTIYERRPLICRVDDFYDAYMSKAMTREEFYRRNKNVCRMFRNEEEIPAV